MIGRMLVRAAVYTFGVWAAYKMKEIGQKYRNSAYHSK